MVVYLLDGSYKKLAILDKAYDVCVEDQELTRTAGAETLSFSMPISDSKWKLLKNELIIEVDESQYRIKEIEDSKKSSKICTVSCDALWYDLADGEWMTHTATIKFSAADAIAECLVGTDWSVGEVTNEESHAYTLDEEVTRLYALRYIQKIFNGKLTFDTKNKLVNFYGAENYGIKTNNVLAYEKNTSEIKRTIDSTELVTRFELRGADDCTIAEINDGVPYVENYSWYDTIGQPRVLKSVITQDDRFSNLYYMKYYMEQYLEVYSQPQISYDISVASLREIPRIGDFVYVQDRDLGIAQWVEVVQRKIYHDNIWKSTLVLDSLQKTLSTEDDVDSTTGTTSSSGTSSDNSNGTPFNLLRNSRGDNSFAYWTNSGFQINSEVGKSGSCSFQNIAGSSTERRLTQRVYPNTADNYRVSCQVEAPDGYEYEDGEKVGIEVTLYFDDGTYQTEYISYFGEEEEEDAD